MPAVNLPLSGAVTQTINPWTAYFSLMGSQFGLINVNLGTSSNPAIEQEVLQDVASYGKQLGRMGDVLAVLVRHLDLTSLTEDEHKAVAAFKRMQEDIADIKERHRSRLVIRP
ncbi:hypothetical protein [Silvimonas sp.]|uniref:hypothetical protein n=1 Tax=Silvimonas sp. TaxID=2650811 RepID=UPI0028404FF3|nr:hypothetical protein [Silvimonas sp.]MDR3428374.1 hypothetical protein [Silvimonas sp.]